MHHTMRTIPRSCFTVISIIILGLTTQFGIPHGVLGSEMNGLVRASKPLKSSAGLQPPVPADFPRTVATASPEIPSLKPDTSRVDEFRRSLELEGFSEVHRDHGPNAMWPLPLPQFQGDILDSDNDRDNWPVPPVPLDTVIPQTAMPMPVVEPLQGTDAPSPNEIETRQPTNRLVTPVKTTPTALSSQPATHADFAGILWTPASLKVSNRIFVPLGPPQLREFLASEETVGPSSTSWFDISFQGQPGETKALAPTLASEATTSSAARRPSSELHADGTTDRVNPDRLATVQFDEPIFAVPPDPRTHEESRPENPPDNVAAGVQGPVYRGRLEDHFGAQPSRHILIGLPHEVPTCEGLMIEPNVVIDAADDVPVDSLLYGRLSLPNPDPARRSFDLAERRLVAAVASPGAQHFEPLFGAVGRRVRGRATTSLTHWLSAVRSRRFDAGVGTERLVYAPFEIDAAQPGNQFRMGADLVQGYQFPDRSEFLWARTGAKGRGPAKTEEGVDFQDLRLQMENGGPKFSLTTMIPLRAVDPIKNANHAGLGDMTLTTKTVLLDGNEWQLTQILRTYLKTGSSTAGLGTGHVSLEPGILVRHRWNDRFVLHGEMKYWFPLGGDPIYSGQVFRWGLGASQLLYETDRFAILPTYEFVNWTAQSGEKTVVPPQSGRVDGDSLTYFFPGTRFVWDRGGDLGLFEFGVSTGLALSRDRMFDTLTRIDLRWAF